MCENVTDRAVQGRLTAVLVEHELVGGECSYWACMPSKALLRAAQHVAGVPTGELAVQAVLARRDSFTNNWSDAEQLQWAVNADIIVVRGYGRITAPREVTVTAPEVPRRSSPPGTQWP